MPDTLFNICRFLLNNLTKDIPPGISKVYPNISENGLNVVLDPSKYLENGALWGPLNVENSLWQIDTILKSRLAEAVKIEQWKIDRRREKSGELAPLRKPKCCWEKEKGCWWGGGADASKKHIFCYLNKCFDCWTLCKSMHTKTHWTIRFNLNKYTHTRSRTPTATWANLCRHTSDSGMRKESAALEEEIRSNSCNPLWPSWNVPKTLNLDL